MICNAASSLLLPAHDVDDCVGERDGCALGVYNDFLVLDRMKGWIEKKFSAGLIKNKFHCLRP
jgi:hypothetical protein